MNWTHTQPPPPPPPRRLRPHRTSSTPCTIVLILTTCVVSLCLADDCSRLWLKGYKLSSSHSQQKPPILKTYNNYDVGQCEAECASTIGCSAFAVGTSRATNGTCELGAAPPRASRSLNSTSSSSSTSDCVERQPSFDVYVIHDADSCRKKRDPLYQPSHISSSQNIHSSSVPIDCFYRLMSGRRLAKPHALKSISVNSLQECQEGCIHEKSFQCRSISYRYMPSGYSYSVSNCELSPFYLTNDRQQQQHDFIDDFDYDFFQREPYCKTDAAGSSQNTFGVCAVVVRRGGRLSPTLARQSSPSTTSQQCEHLCTTSLFRCRAFAFRHTERGRYTVPSRSITGGIRSDDGCLLYESELSRLPSYNVETDPDFDLYEMGRLMNGKCMLDQRGHHHHTAIYTPERYPPVTSTLRPPPYDRYPTQHHQQQQGGVSYYPPPSRYPPPYNDRPQDRQDYYGHNQGGVTGSKYDQQSNRGHAAPAGSVVSSPGGGNYPQVTGTSTDQHSQQRPSNNINAGGGGTQSSSSWGQQGHQQQPNNYPPQQQQPYYPPMGGHHHQERPNHHQQQDFFSGGHSSSSSSSSGSSGGGGSSSSSSYYPPLPQQHHPPNQGTRPEPDDRISNVDRPPYPRPVERPYEDETIRNSSPGGISDRPPPSPPSGDFPPPQIGPPTGSTNPLRPLEPPVSFMDKVDHHHTPSTHQQLPSPHDETGISTTTTHNNKDFYDPKMEVCLRPLRHDAWLVPEVSRATFPVKTLEECRVECIRATDVLRFPCRTMAYHHTSSSGGTCQLSDMDGRDLRETDYVMSSRDTGNNRFSREGGGVTLYYDETNPQCPVRLSPVGGVASSRYPPAGGGGGGGYYPPPSASYPPSTNYHHQSSSSYYPPGGSTYPPYDSSSRGYHTTSYQQYDHYHDNNMQQQRPSDFYNTKFNRVQYGSAATGQNYGGGGGGYYGGSGGGGSSGGGSGGYYDYQHQGSVGGGMMMTTTVDGERCLHSCVRNQDAGFYYCQIDREGAWNFCCRPDEGGECGYSRGLSFSWCYVGTGPSRNIWRTCNYRGAPTSNTNNPYNSRYTSPSAMPHHVSYLHDRQPPTVQKLAVSELANLTRDDAAILFKENNKDSDNNSDDDDTITIHSSSLIETNLNSTSTITPSNNSTKIKEP